MAYIAVTGVSRLADEMVRHSTPTAGKVDVFTFPTANEASRAISSAQADETFGTADATHRQFSQLSAGSGLSGHHTRSYTNEVSQ